MNQTPVSVFAARPSPRSRGVEPLESRIAPALATPFPLGSLAGGNGFTISGSGAGQDVSIVGDVNGDGFDDMLVGVLSAPAAAYVVFGKAGGFDPNIDLTSLNGTNGFAITKATAVSGANFGIVVGAAGDLNGDGFADLAVASDAEKVGALSFAGAVYVIFGKATFSGSVDVSSLDGSNGFKLTGEKASDRLGSDIAPAGDLNADGFSDLVVSAAGADGGKGAAYVIFGRSTGFSATTQVGSLLLPTGFKISGEKAGDFLGLASSAGDVNGDGIGDLVLGSAFSDSKGANSGTGYVVFGKRGDAANVNLATLTGSNGFKVRGAAAGEYAGFGISGAGDINGDGFSDLLIGAPFASPGASKAGAAYVVFGGYSFSAVVELSALDGTTGFKLTGASANDFTGYSVAAAGDLNGDGFDDAIIGTSRISGANGGAYVVYGKAGSFPATVALATLQQGEGFPITGTIGYRVTGGGDINGDGLDDLLIGVRDFSRAYLVLGFDTGAITHPGNANANTLTGDANANVIIGAQAGDTLIGNGGADVLRGGQGDDVLAISDTSFLRIHGGNGIDTLRLDGAGLSLNLTQFPQSRIQSIERIDLTGSGDNFLTLDATAVLALAPYTNVLTVTGDAGDAVDFGAGWSIFGQETIGATVFNVFVAGAATLKVAAAVTTSTPSGLHPHALDGTLGSTITGAFGSQFARSITSAGDVNGDGFDDFIAGVYAASFPGGGGAAYVIFGKAGGLPANLDVATLDGTNGFRITGTPATITSFGRAVSGAGDVNGDGFADVIVGGFNESPNASKSGAAFVIFGQAGGFDASISVTELNSAGKPHGFKMSGNVYRENVGATVGSAGDVNGDGFDDVIVGAGGADFGGANAGAAYIVFGKAGGFATNIQLAALTGADGFRIIGKEAKSYLGSSVNSAGDINGDGFDDVVVSSISSGAGGKYSGVAYVVFGKATFAKEVVAGTGGFRIKGAAPGDRLGLGAGGAGDVNGDGISDLVVSAFNSNANGTASGAAYVIFGQTTSFGADFSLAGLNGSNGFRLLGGKPGDLAGYAASAAGDVNGDGFDDVIVGASGGLFSGAAFGDSYVVYGQAGFAADFNLGTIDGANGFKLVRAHAGDGSGSAVSNAGDVNGDGFDDVLVGAPFASPNVAYLIYGFDSGAVTHPGNANANTLTGDGGANVIVAGQAGDTLLGNGGSDSFRGGQGDDLIAVGDLGFFRIAGGTGLDTLRLDGSGFALNLHGLAGTKIHGIEQIDLTGSGANSLTITKLDVLNLAPQSNTLTVLGDAGDTVNFGPGWIKEVDQTSGPTTFHVFTSGAATLRIALGVATPDRPSGYTLPTFDGATGFVVNGAAANDYANRVFGAGDVNGDGFDDFIVGARNAKSAGIATGTAYVIFGKAGGFTSPVNVATLSGADGFAIRGGQASDQLGFSASAAGDFNGDGFGDILVGAFNADGTQPAAGAAYLIYGKSGPFGPALDVTTLDGTNGFKLRGISTGDRAGLSVDSAGDVNGDGFDDIVIGAPDGKTGAVLQTGRAYVVFGSATRPGSAFDILSINGTNGFRIAGTAKFELAGISVGGADVNGDGFSDVIVGSQAGKTYVVFGKAAGFVATVDTSSLNGTNGFTIDGTSLNGSAGQSVSAAGDVNGDSIGDLLVGAPNAASNGTTSGSAFVVFGKLGATFGKTVDLTKLNGATGFQIIGREANAYLGESVSAAGDVNGDGFDDVIVGAALVDARAVQAGEAYVIYGAATFAPSLNVGALNGVNGFSLVGVETSRAGRSVSGAGDVNGDGFDDVIVGSYGTSGAGRGVLVFGFDSGKVTQQGGLGANAFTATAGADVIVAGQGDDTVTNAGTGDVLRGGEGDDRFSFTSPGLKRLIGGHGFDTLELTGGLLLDLTARPTYRINGFEQVDLRPGVNGISLDARAVLNLSPDTNTLIVRADASDIVNIGTIGGGGWTITGSEVFDGETLTVLTQGAATLKVSPFIAPVVTLVDAKTATYTDVDGDLVTIKTSKGTLGVSDFYLIKTGIPGGAQLAAINFADDGTEFQGSDLTITATRTALGGDGRVNVGRLDATGVDLGKVSIDGDLGRFNAGDATLTTPGTLALNVGSLGVFGTSTQGAGGVLEFTVRGTLGTLTVQSDICNERLNVFAPAGGIGFDGVDVGGSVIADGVAITGFYTDGSTGAIKVGGDLRGGPGGAGTILSFDIGGNIGSLSVGGSLAAGVNTGIGAINAGGSFGPITIGGDLDHTKLAAVKSFARLTVGGSVLSSRVLAGYDLFEIPTNGDATIGAVKVSGDWVASSLVAGVVSSDPFFGNGGDKLITSGSPAVSGGDPTKIAKVASIAIAGEVLGTPGGTDHFGFVAEEIGSFSVGGTKFPLLKGAGNDLSGLRVGSTLDVKVREVKILGTFEQPPAVEDPVGGPSFSLGSLDGTNGFRFDGLAQGEQAGRTVAAAGDVNGDGFDDLIVGAAGAKVPGQINIGEAYVIFGTNKGLPASLDAKDLNGKNGFRIQADLGNTNSYFALAVGGAGDVNNDGFDDLIVGGIAIGDLFVGSTEKAVVIFGHAGSFAPAITASSLDGNNGFVISHPFAPDPNLSTYIRMSVSGAGDLNSDGYGDVVVGAVNADFGTQNSGSAYVVFSPGPAKPASIDVSTLNGTTGFRLDGPGAFANLGYSTSRAGDVNGDGFDDLIVGAPRAQVGGAASGSGYVVFGKAAGVAFPANFGVGSLNGANGFRIPAIDHRGDTANTVSGGGDVNGDGIDDIVIGAPYAYDGPSAYPGKSYVIFGKRTSVVGNFPADFLLGSLNGANGFKITGESSYDYAGRAVIAGDINGDGMADIAIGAIGLEAHNEFRGGAYVVFGKATPPANVLLSSLDGLNGVKLLGAQAGDQAGLGISGAGDFNGDGKADLLVGAYSAAITTTNQGAAFLVSGASLTYGVDISSDGKTAAFTDVDGDRVTIKTNAGGFVPGDFVFKPAGQSGGIQLQKLDLSGGAHEAFAGANLTFTATRGPTGGDGFVNVGAIIAGTHDLGAVTIDGDLGQLDAGNGDPLKPAVAALTVHSLGQLGLSTQVPVGASLESNLAGKLGSLNVKSDVVGAFVNVAGSANAGDDDVGAVTIGGSLRGGALANSGSLFAAGDLGAVKIGGSVLGGVGPHSGSIEAGATIASANLADSLRGGVGAVSGSIIAGTTLGAITIGGDVNSGRIFAKGNLLPGSTALALAIKSVSIGGSVARADIFAGYDRTGAPVNGAVQIGAVKVGRDWIASDLVAGVQTGVDGFFGNGDTPIPSGSPVVSKIASILIGGQMLGTPNTISSADHFGFVAAEIGAFTIGSTAIKLAPGGGNDLAGLPVGATLDVRLREVS